MKFNIQLSYLYSLLGFICIFASTPTTLQAQCTICTTTISTSSSAAVEVDGILAKLCITGGTFTGTISLKNGAKMCIGTNATFSATSMTFSNSSIVDNYGTWNTSGFTLGNPLNNYGAMTINGSMTTNSGGVFTSAGTSLTITGSLEVNDAFNLTGDASIGGALKTNGSGIITINDGVLDVAGDFENNGQVTANGSSSCGQISVGGFSKNQGNFGQDGSNLDICDASGTDDGFDQNDRTIPGSVTNCTCSATLPVELISFTVKKKDDYAIVEWATIQEENSSHFILERSSDGFNFEPIGNLEAHNNSSSLREYQFFDYENQLSTSYYRLKQVDLDERFTYSKVIVLVKDAVSEDNIFGWNHNTSRLTIMTNTLLNFSLYQADGRVMDNYELNQSELVDLSSLRGGVYIIHYQTPTGHGVFRFLKG